MNADHESMQFVSAVTTETGQDDTARRLAAEVNQGLSGRPVSLCVLFASAHFEDEVERLADELHDTLRPHAFIGATAEAVIAGNREYEHEPALTLWAAHLPGVQATSFHISEADRHKLDSPDAWQDYLHVSAEQRPCFVLLGDPFTINVVRLLEQLEEAYADRPAIGGMASAADRPGQNHLVFDGHTLHQGLVGVALRGAISMEAVVSQGARPIGQQLVITKADRNVIHQLGGKPALAVAAAVLQRCAPRDRERIEHRGLLVGRVVDEYQDHFDRGDFLIRNAIGVDRESGAMTVNDLVRVGQTVQFHVRDGATASEDLALLLTATRGQPAAGALLFSCAGRGTRMFPQRSHDAQAVVQACGRLPLAGFHCAGEIGPVRSRNFVLGHTASIGLFRPLDLHLDG
ncbi:MAG: FIST C-terminal domain-containing protein [Planctomycetes bacterium]|nr:FIST C-terminal domain-containing protein [Planctomycetota bacterium]